MCLFLFLFWILPPLYLPVCMSHKIHTWSYALSTFPSLKFITVSFLQIGQKTGKFFASVSGLSFVRVLPPQMGQYTHVVCAMIGLLHQYKSINTAGGALHLFLTRFMSRARRTYRSPRPFLNAFIAYIILYSGKKFVPMLNQICIPESNR